MRDYIVLLEVLLYEEYARVDILKRNWPRSILLGRTQLGQVDTEMSQSYGKSWFRLAE